MKNISFLLILLLVCFSSCKTIKPAAEIRPEVKQTQIPVTDVAPAAINFSDQSTWLLGYFNPDRLTREPYSIWYIKGYDEYQFNSDAINKLQDISKDNLTIKIVMGTWCPDSRREVPRFMRILDIWKFPVSIVTFIGVDNAKLSPVEKYDKLDIRRVPTFIIYENNIEAGRIIENPTTSLEQDMVNILTRDE
jgi:thiol-disulfide isomerase/thioredoxin